MRAPAAPVVLGLALAACAPAQLIATHDDPYRRPWVVALPPEETADGIAAAVRDPVPDAPEFDARRAGRRADGGVERLDAAREVSIARGGPWRVSRVDTGTATVYLRRAGFPAPVVVMVRAYASGDGRSVVRAWSRNRFVGSAGRRLAELMAMADRYWRKRGVAAAAVGSEADLAHAAGDAGGGDADDGGDPAAASPEAPLWP